MVRVLIAGDVDGRLDVLYKRVSTLHNSTTHGPFDYLFCTGNFLSETLPNEENTSIIEDYICGIVEAPLPTYFTSQLPLWIQEKYSMTPLKGKEELCSNIIYLGDNGLHLVDRLTIGSYSAKNSLVGTGRSKEEVKELFHTQTIRNKTYIGCDILLTDEWGQGIVDGLYGKDEILTSHYQSQSDSGVSYLSFLGSSDVAEIAAYSRPRYHFASGEGIYYQRTPYLSVLAPPEPPIKFQNVTRFIGLGTVSNRRQIQSKKLAKWLHALSIEPVSTQSANTLKQASTDLETYHPNPYHALIGDLLEDTYCSSKILTSNSTLTSHHINEQINKRKRNDLDSNGNNNNMADPDANTAVTGGTFFWGNGVDTTNNKFTKKSRVEKKEEIVDPANLCLYVGNIPPIVKNKKDLYDHLHSCFSLYGTVDTIKIKTKIDAQGNIVISNAFVTFICHEDALRANQVGNGPTGILILNSHRLRVNWATSKVSSYEKTGTGTGTSSLSILSKQRNEGMGQKQSQQPCWFCMSSENFDANLVIAIGDHFYLTLPKGPLHMLHMLLVPVEHKTSLFTIPLEGGIEREYVNFRKAIVNYFKVKGFVPIFYERRVRPRYLTPPSSANSGGNSSSSNSSEKEKAGLHTHLQIIPIPIEKYQNSDYFNLVELFEEKIAFASQLEKSKVSFEKIETNENYPMGTVEQGFYFYVEMVGKEGKGVEKEKDETNANTDEDEANTIITSTSNTRLSRYIYHIPHDVNLSVNFAREVLAEYLNSPSKADWKACELSKEEEESLMTTIKTEFSPYDPTEE